MKIQVEYRLITSLAKNERRQICKRYNSFVPQINDIVNIDGNPFVVHRISYAIPGDKQDKMDYVFVDVFKAGTYTLILPSGTF